ncbi:MAG: hypothetical protein N2C14_00100, partial [Planctomycetales bacterium]
MPNDPYALCPCGSGKKIKFCCKDLADKMDKVSRMMSGEQFSSALSQLSSLEKSNADHPWILTTKARAEFHLKQFADAEHTVNHLLETSPDNLTGLALRTILYSRPEQDMEPAEILEPLQRALEIMDESVPDVMVMALPAAANALARHGMTSAVLAHLATSFAFDSASPWKDSYNELLSSQQTPMLVKDYWLFDDELPEDQPWSKDYREALTLAGRGAWLAASKRLEKLAEQAPEHAQIHRHLGMCRLFLGNHEGAAESLRRFVPLTES